MPALVPIPWQPTLFLTPSTLGYLQRASDRLGRHIFLAGSDAAHRAYARQDFLWEGYLKKLAGVPGYQSFNTASNPDTGQRSHMRGAAFDALNTDAATQAACRAVGLVRDGVETWHWNDPHWASMPIIPTNTATAGSGSTPLPDLPTAPTYQEDDDMPNMWSDTNGTIWFGPVGIGAGDQADVLIRYLKSTPDARDTFNGTQGTWIRNYLGSANAFGMPATTMPTFDTTKLASALADALATKQIAVDPTSLKAPLDAAFSRSLTAIAKAAADQTKVTLNWDPVLLTSSIVDAVVKALPAADSQAVQDAVTAAMNRATAAIGKSLQAVQ